MIKSYLKRAELEKAIQGITNAIIIQGIVNEKIDKKYRYKEIYNDDLKCIENNKIKKIKLKELRDYLEKFSKTIKDIDDLKSLCV